jgi:hypothetical protein
VRQRPGLSIVDDAKARRREVKRIVFAEAIAAQRSARRALRLTGSREAAVATAGV